MVEAGPFAEVLDATVCTVLLRDHALDGAILFEHVLGALALKHKRFELLARQTGGV